MNIMVFWFEIVNVTSYNTSNPIFFGGLNSPFVKFNLVRIVAWLNFNGYTFRSKPLNAPFKKFARLIWLSIKVPTTKFAANTGGRQDKVAFIFTNDFLNLTL